MIGYTSNLRLLSDTSGTVKIYPTDVKEQDKTQEEEKKSCCISDTLNDIITVCVVL
jgi:hypothetical protein